jgi:hypothetical protein
MNESPHIFNPILTPFEITKESTIFSGYVKTVRFIVCENAYLLAKMSREYFAYSKLHSKLLVDLAKSILDDDPDIIKKVPEQFVNQVREWLLVFQNADISNKYRQPNTFGSSLEFHIVCPEVLNDSLYKKYIPFSSLYSLYYNEDNIEKMMKEITEAVYESGYYAHVMYPFAEPDNSREHNAIALKIIRGETPAK